MSAGLPDAGGRAGIARRFATPAQRNYVRGKLVFDPVYAAAAPLFLETPLPVLDVGCGMGLLGHYLHACGHRAGYLGIDIDERKIAAGRSAAGTLDGAMAFACTDLARAPAASGHVALLDMLHYLPATQQAPLLRRAAACVAPGGRLVIRNVLRAPNWRFRLTVAEEFLLHAVGWMRVGAQHYPSGAELLEVLTASGLDVQTSPLWGRTPFNSHLVVGRRPD